MNKSDRRANLSIQYALIDIGLISLSYAAAVFFKPADQVVMGLSWYIALLAVFCVVYFLFMMAFRMYNRSTFFYMDRVIKNTLLSLGGTSVAIFAFVSVAYDTTYNRLFLLVFLTLCLSTLITGKIIVFKWKKKAVSDKKVIYAGEEELYDKFVHYMGLSGFHYSVLGYIGRGKKRIDNLKYLGDIGDFEDILRKHPCDHIFFTQSLTKPQSVERYLDVANEMGIIAQIILDVHKPESAKWYISSLGTYPMLTYYTVTLDPVALAVKRVMDILGAVFGIIITAPIMVAAAIAIKCDSKGPVIFKQERVGRNGQRFFIYKFRSMYVDAESRLKDLESQNIMSGDGRIFKVKDDPRITKVGKFLRKTSIDELPQFINVLIGNMSLVGTRPPTVSEVEKYDRKHYRRISIKPGITGIWQTSGRSDVTDFEEIVKMDVEYIDKWSLILDFTLIMRTIKAVVRKAGAY